MTIASISITPHPEHPGWYYLTFTSWTNSIGKTTTEMLVTIDNLKALHRELGKVVPPEPREEDFPENIRRFRRETKDK